jgi:hypothetical protein
VSHPSETPEKATHLHAVVDETAPEPARIPTPAEAFMRQHNLEPIAQRYRAAASELADLTVPVPVADLPFRKDAPATEPQPFTIRVTADAGSPGSPSFEVAGVAYWREHDGRLDVYGPVTGGRVAKILSRAPFTWVQVERTDRIGRAL